MPKNQTAPVAIDLDLIEEAYQEPFSFVVGGERFDLPLGSALNWNAIAIMQRGDLEGGLRALLGDQYERFERHNVSLAKVNALFESYAKHFNTSLGE